MDDKTQLTHKLKRLSTEDVNFKSHTEKIKELRLKQFMSHGTNIADISLLRDVRVSLASLESEENEYTLQEILDLQEDSLGLKVLVTAKQASFLGVINMVLKECSKMFLEKAINFSTRRERHGLRMFFFREVISIKVLGKDKEARERLLKDFYIEKRPGKKVIRKKLMMSCLARGEPFPRKPALPDSPPPRPASPPPLPEKLPRSYNWIDVTAIDNVYKSALSMIKQEMVISLSIVGQGVGRSGTLVWLSVATSTMIFHFDVVNIGSSRVMEEGLGAVLQNRRIVKVMHDCRGFEDLLHHQMKINLNNVYDIQAADIYLNMLDPQKPMLSVVPTLSSLLKKYLRLTLEQMPPSEKDHSEVNLSLWLKRPLSQSLGDRLSMYVVYLREVRLEQLEMILVNLRQVTELYMGAMRDKDSLSLSQMDPKLVPIEIQKLGEQLRGHGKGKAQQSGQCFKASQN